MRIHQQPPSPDLDRVREIQLASRKDLRNGTLLVVGLPALSGALFLMFDFRPRIAFFAALFWGVILLIRGFRLRREAWELEHLGSIQREQDGR